MFTNIYKGLDKAFISVQNQHKQVVQQCDDFIECRYFGAAEACWRIFGFKVGQQLPSVITLPIHLKHNQTTYFNEKKQQEIKEKETQLTQYFANNKKEKENPLSIDALGKFRDGTIRPPGTALLYHEYPQFYQWNKKDRIWRRRTKSANY